MSMLCFSTNAKKCVHLHTTDIISTDVCNVPAPSSVKCNSACLTQYTQLPDAAAAVKASQKVINRNGSEYLCLHEIMVLAQGCNLTEYFMKRWLMAQSVTAKTVHYNSLFIVNNATWGEINPTVKIMLLCIFLHDFCTSLPGDRVWAGFVFLCHPLCLVNCGFQHQKVWTAPFPGTLCSTFWVTQCADRQRLRSRPTQCSTLNSAGVMLVHCIQVKPLFVGSIKRWRVMDDPCSQLSIHPWCKWVFASICLLTYAISFHVYFSNTYTASLRFW